MPSYIYPDCDHPQFKIESKVQRFGKSSTLRLRLHVYCEACGKQFEFMGLPNTGYNPRGAGTTEDRRNVFLAIQPATSPLVMHAAPLIINLSGA